MTDNEEQGIVDTRKTNTAQSDLLEISLAGLTIDDENKEELVQLLARVTPDLEQVKDVDSRSRTNTNESEVYDLADIEPVELWDDEEDKDAFTEEELINVLRSFDDDEEEAEQDKGEDTLEFPIGETLPELDLEVLEADDSLLLPPAEFTASIFDQPSSKEEDDELQQDDEQVEEKKRELDEDDLGLLEGLQNLNLDWQPEDDDLPPYLWCQPCTPVGTSEESSRFSLASIAEDKTLLDTGVSSIDLSQFHDTERPKLPQKEFDTLLTLSLLNLEDGEDNPYLTEAEMDSLFEKGAAVAALENNNKNSGQDSIMQEEQQQSPSAHHHQHEHPEHEALLRISQRPEALELAGDILSSFVANAAGLENERSCLGHKDTIFGAAFSECGNYLATASQDSTVRIFDVATNACLSVLSEHSTDHECLRVAWASSEWAKDKLKRGKDSHLSTLLATAGADGTVKIWASKDPKQKDSWTCCSTIDHTAFDRISVNPDDEAEEPQVYAIQWIDHWRGLPVADGNAPSSQNSFLLSSSDDFIHLWELKAKTDDSDSIDLGFREVMSLNFSSFHNQGYGVSICQVTQTGLTVPNAEGKSDNGSLPAAVQKPFGGERNPHNMIFAFDADYCPANGLLGVALSDGSLRLINGRGVCISIMQLPGCQSHLTSFSWDSTGTRLATCVATGHVILWGVQVHDGMGSLTTTCAAILEGGHEPGRPVFGSRFFADGENLLLSWGVDGRLCLWDAFSLGNIDGPIATVIANADYPIYAVDVQKSCLAVGGGGGEASFLGVPVNLYDIATSES